MVKYIYQNENWTDFTWNNASVSEALGKVRLLQGKLMGQIQSLGFSSKEEKNLDMLALDVVKSSEIEGELLNYEQVRSSIARHLGINTAGLVPSPRNIEGVIDMMLDATQNFRNLLNDKRLFAWHGALFPTGRSGLYKIEVAQYRTGEMQVVSGGFGHEKVHYEALSAKDVKSAMDKFLSWLNDDNYLIDEVLKSAIAHFWFVIIHPFDDGNGRIARAISDMLLARSENSSERFYSLSNQIQKEKNTYYDTLKVVQHSNGDITKWLLWFLKCLEHALLETEESMQNILLKAEFWEQHKYTAINERQRMMINKLFDNFFGNLTTSKWAKITKTSTDTALRDIKDLIEKNILQQGKSGGRSVNYELIKH
ncbi:cell division protein Fic [Bacteroidia bacterium]|nr:cell division protein Fic [Bacteroidia bacterium]